MNVVLRFNLFEKEQWAKLCALKVSQRRTIETLKKSPPKQRNGVLSGTRLFAFQSA
jgi:hypothetical protein